jgi:hypothetical protein
MEKQYTECVKSPVNLIHPNLYKQINIEILEKMTFDGTPKKIANDYWNAYITAFGSLIERYGEELNKQLLINS